MAKTQAESLVEVLVKDADAKVKDKEREVKELTQLVVQADQQCQHMQNYLQSAILQVEEFQTRSETEMRQLKVEYSARRNSDLERLQKTNGEEIRRWQEVKNTEMLELRRIY